MKKTRAQPQGFSLCRCAGLICLLTQPTASRSSQLELFAGWGPQGLTKRLRFSEFIYQASKAVLREALMPSPLAALKQLIGCGGAISAHSPFTCSRHS